MSSKERLRIAMDLVRTLLGDDKRAMSELAFQLLQLSTGMRKRLTAPGRRGPRKPKGGLPS
jgi:hypothetical protein